MTPSKYQWEPQHTSEWITVFLSTLANAVKLVHPVGWIKPPHKDVHILSPRTYYCYLYGNKDFIDTIKLMTTRWDIYPGLSGWAQCKQNGP